MVLVMRKFLTSAIIALIVIIGVTTAMAYPKFFSKKTVDKNLYFINTKLFISGNVGQDITFPVIFITDKQFNPANAISDILLINSGNAEIKKWEIKDGNEYKDCKLNNASLVMKIKKPGIVNIEGLKVRFKDGVERQYEYGDWLLYGLDGIAKNIDIATKEMYIASNAKTHFDFKNLSNSTIKINNINLVSDKVKVKNAEFKLDDKVYKDINGIELGPSKIIDINFQTELSDKVDLYFIKPYIEYTLSGNEYKETITNGTVYGLPFSEEKMSSMYHQYYKSK